MAAQRRAAALALHGERRAAACARYEESQAAARAAHAAELARLAEGEADGGVVEETRRGHAGQSLRLRACHLEELEVEDARLAEALLQIDRDGNGGTAAATELRSVPAAASASVVDKQEGDGLRILRDAAASACVVQAALRHLFVCARLEQTAASAVAAAAQVADEEDAGRLAVEDAWHLSARRLQASQTEAAAALRLARACAAESAAQARGRLAAEAAEAAARASLARLAASAKPVLQSFCTLALDARTAACGDALRRHAGVLLAALPDTEPAHSSDLAGTEAAARAMLLARARASLRSARRAEACGAERRARRVLETEEQGARAAAARAADAARRRTAGDAAAAQVQRVWRGRRGRLVARWLRSRRVAAAATAASAAAGGAEEAAARAQEADAARVLLLGLVRIRRARRRRRALAAGRASAACAAAAAASTSARRVLRACVAARVSAAVVRGRREELVRRAALRRAAQLCAAAGAVQRWALAWTARARVAGLQAQARAGAEAGRRGAAAARLLVRAARGGAARARVGWGARVARSAATVVQAGARAALAAVDAAQRRVCARSVARRQAALLQAACRAVLAARHRRTLARAVAAASCIQRGERARVARATRRQLAAEKARCDDERVRRGAATCIQGAYRGFAGRRRARALRRVWNHRRYDAWQARCGAAAGLLGRVHRGCAARQALAARRAAAMGAAAAVQRAWRAHAARAEAAARRGARAAAALGRRRRRAAARLQGAWRAALARRRVAARRAEAAALRRATAAAGAALQRVARGAAGREALRRARLRRGGAAVVLQCCWRGRLASREAAARRRAAATVLLGAQRVRAACLVQTAYRAHDRRRRAAVYRLQRFFARTRPYAESLRGVYLEKKRLRRLGLRCVEAAEARGRAAFEREEAAARPAPTPAVFAEPAAAAATVETDAAPVPALSPLPPPSPPAVSNASVALRNFLTEEACKRRIVTAAAAEGFRAALGEESAQRRLCWKGWAVAAAARVLGGFLRAERRGRAEAETLQVAERRALRLRHAKAVRVAHAKHARAAAARRLPPLPAVAGVASGDSAPVRPGARGAAALRGRGSCVDASGTALSDEACRELMALVCGAGGGGGGDEESVQLSLRLDHTQLSDEGVRAVAGVLRDSRSVTWLSLAGNEGVTDEGAAALIDALRGNPTVRHADVSGTSVSHGAVLAIEALLADELTGAPRVQQHQQRSVVYAKLRPLPSSDGAATGTVPAAKKRPASPLPAHFPYGAR